MENLIVLQLLSLERHRVSYAKNDRQSQQKSIIPVQNFIFNLVFSSSLFLPSYLYLYIYVYISKHNSKLKNVLRLLGMSIGKAFITYGKVVHYSQLVYVLEQHYP